mmetsp:Transcript_9482/g.29240  ORF Transcript_9482/g.29240 Transcript_9482/m.29240 type:complete len:178 (-) Transcript_9482:36-569(-)|eukprot:CAMPEP_0177629042 /NCGR_PEP_ID=MMETSP0447-20121125/454_1 /TAXON_ID=0 /ORGANISM="Stygamoeba regulata, Strain BSH-02190019" /LENGTH=177 /DNA_ID=CAMNT_0019130331 /DNA_START=51 /DNA_END=584 /DNA_ORIENTATION=+
MPIREFSVVGRRRPSDEDPNPTVYRMRLFAPTATHATSRFWYFMSKYRKMKKTTGEILQTNEVFEKRPQTVKNFGIWVVYNSRSGTHNLYKEFRDTTRCGAVAQMYMDMASRHRARFRTIQIREVLELPANKCKRPNITQFHNPQIRFPLHHRVIRAPSRARKSTFLAKRPNTFFSN